MTTVRSVAAMHITPQTPKHANEADQSSVNISFTSGTILLNYVSFWYSIPLLSKLRRYFRVWHYCFYHWTQIKALTYGN